MKTFETEKHNIPEGATHYSEEQLGAYFCWYIISSDNAEIAVLDGVGFGLNWHACEHSEQFGDNVKPIPQTNIETPEEKEALDLIDTTPHQYEMSKFSGNKPRTKAEYVKCEFKRVSDLVLECESGGVLYCESSSGEIGVELCMYGAISMHRHSDNLYRRIETQMTERDEFIGECKKLEKQTAVFGKVISNKWFEAMYDSGKFKLVESN
jgi:hypothetical protein